LCSEIGQEKGHKCYIESMTKKGRLNFWAVKWKLFLKKGHSKFLRPPKLGAKSPPMIGCIL